MYGYICVKNLSCYPVISVYINDTLYFADVLTTSPYKPVDAGSAQVKILNNRSKMVLDIYLPIKSHQRYILEVFPETYSFTPVGFS